MEQVEVKKSVCMWCHAHCVLASYVKNGQLLKVEEYPGHPRSEALKPAVKACARARYATEWMYHPDRLSYPLKRAGERGQGKWQRLSWEQALDEIALKLAEIKNKFGAEAVASSRGTLRSQEEYRRRFLNLFGTPNMYGAEINLCFAPRNAMASAVVGWPVNEMSHSSKTKLVLLIGTNPAQHGVPSWLVLRKIKNEGTKLIVIDPRHTQTAEIADIWLQLRPGTDCALLMGMINVIIEEGLYDKEFVNSWCFGFDRLVERARQYPLEKVAQITWVPSEKIIQAARLYATSKPANTRSEMGLEHLTNSMEAIHAKYILSAITGNIDISGADLLHPLHPKVRSEAEIELNDALPATQKAKMLGADRFRIFSWAGYQELQKNIKRVWGKELGSNTASFAHSPTLYRAAITGQPYPVKAVLTLASNPMVTQANIKLAYKALKSLDLYVVMDFWMTPSAEIADYVLPAASWLERPTLYMRYGYGDQVEVGEAALPARVEGKYDRRTDYDFWRGLGLRLGQGELWPWEDLEAALSYRIEPLGYDVQQFIKEKGGWDLYQWGEKKYEKLGFATPTGKVEVHSTILEKLGYDPLPHYEEPAESPISTPDLAKDYPFILITGGRVLPYYHSEHRQIDSLRRQHPYPLVQIHPETASQLNLADGDWSWIETPRGRVRMKVSHFSGIDPRVIHAEHGWWFPELPGEEPWLHGVWESNINVVTDDDPEHCNKIGGSWPLRGELCRVYKAKTY